LILAFVFENIENIYRNNASAIIENIFLLSGSILLVLAVLMELNIVFSKNKFVSVHKQKKSSSKYKYDKPDTGRRR